MKKSSYLINLGAGATKLAFLLLLSFSCGSKTQQEDPPETPAVQFAKGADVGWLTQMEAAGKKFYNSSGTEQDCIQILKNTGMNSIRLRVWVDPAGGWNNTADVVAKAIRAKNLGMRIMIDFHYSDSWADPGQQTKPASWAAQDFTALQTSVYNHTFNVLTALKAGGVTPEWVQVGNETNDGMLWPTGKASLNMANFSALVKQGYNAVKAVDSSIKVIIHLSNGFDNSLYRWIFDGLKNNGVSWDIIGMSLYPEPGDWQIRNEQCLVNMNDMVARYNKPVMIVEVGMSWDQASACQSFISDLITKVKSVAGNKGLGVFYWEPQSYGNWQGYTKGAFDNSGKPTIALNAFN
ncbi:MAG: glycosyl hydrolase 53 family protein [Chitinophagaceae bacterium]|nr:glycosyl hydrolase 53 family protein [Chitinophagaceae bacterium]